MRRNRLLVAATAAAVSLTTWAVTTGQAAVGETSGRAPTAASAALPAGVRAAPPGIKWGRCTDPTLRQVHARCGFVTVPLDYSDPSAGTVRLAVSRLKHTTRTSQGVMLTNPGGPGGSGLIYAFLGKIMPKGSGRSYDWIGFDPRGVGSSKPAISCRPGYFHGDRPPYRPTGKALVQTWLSRSRSYARGCERYGALLGNMTTTDAVRDMDRIRQALGVSRINFYGYSYGTYLGQVYATMFPAHVRRMVLDSNVDPRRVWYQANLDQDVAFERAFHVFFRWVARHRATYHLGRTGKAVERLYLRQERVLRRHPANGVLGPSEWDDAFLLAGYLQVAWPPVAQAFSGWVHHRRPRPLIRLWRSFDAPGDDNGYAVYNAVTCTDAPSPTVSAELRDARRLDRVAPILTWSNTWYSAPCLFWPAPPGSPVTVDGHGVRALLVDQTLDAATPFEGSLEVRSRFAAARLVAIRGGTTHASTPDLSGPCADARIAAFLERGALPARLPGRRADVSCPAPPRPQPGAARTARSIPGWLPRLPR